MGSFKKAQHKCDSNVRANEIEKSSWLGNKEAGAASEEILFKFPGEHIENIRSLSGKVDLMYS